MEQRNAPPGRIGDRGLMKQLQAGVKRGALTANQVFYSLRETRAGRTDAWTNTPLIIANKEISLIRLINCMLFKQEPRASQPGEQATNRHTEQSFVIA